MNGYFQIINEQSGIFLKLVPPTSGGEKIQIKELVSYLSFNKIEFDIKALNNELESLSETKTIFISNQKILPVKESSFITISPDHMKVTARFYPASNDGKVYQKDDVLSDLRINKVVFGIAEAAIDKYLTERNYCTDYILANGIPTREGKDAFITYNFPTDNKIRPTLNEDGSVDFFNLNVLNHVNEGDILAVLTPEDRGDEGKDVLGNTIKPRDVKRMSLSFGLNIELSEDRTQIKSLVNGHVSLTNGKVFVSNVFEAENVDNSTGNIVYEGDVKINGNVCTNFSVKAKGNVEVAGVVEGAYIEAGGNVILKRGMNGMNKGNIVAGGNVIAKYIENGSVSAGGYVETESILHSNVQAKTEVNVVSKKGFITGGYVCATNVIRVKTLGTAMGSLTEVVVGTDPSINNRYAELNKEIVETQKQLKQMLPVLEVSKQKLAAGVKLLPEQVKKLQELALSVKTLQAKLVDDAKEIQELKEIMDSSSDARVEITGEVFPGTKISISDVSLIIKDSWSYCRFVKDQGTVQMKPL